MSVLQRVPLGYTLANRMEPLSPRHQNVPGVSGWCFPCYGRTRGTAWRNILLSFRNTLGAAYKSDRSWVCKTPDPRQYAKASNVHHRVCHRSHSGCKDTERQCVRPKRWDQTPALPTIPFPVLAMSAQCIARCCRGKRTSCTRTTYL